MSTVEHETIEIRNLLKWFSPVIYDLSFRVFLISLGGFSLPWDN